MSSTLQTFIGIGIFTFVSLTALQAVAGQNIPIDAMLQPEWLGHSDRSVLIPGIGRVMVPKKGSHYKSFNYNPITGATGGHGASIPGVGGSRGGATHRDYVPGRDDMLLPNPGVEVPNPVGGGVPASSGP